MSDLEQQIREALDALCEHDNELWDCAICLPKRIAAAIEIAAMEVDSNATRPYPTRTAEDVAGAAALRALKGEV